MKNEKTPNFRNSDFATKLEEMVAERLVNKQKHPDADLFIYNYSQSVQYGRIWNEVTLQTRGLILDAEMNIVARPFRKFFNLTEHETHEIPQLPFEVFDKMDGSLGILYWLNDRPFIATRGSFTSEQAIHATEILHQKYAHTFDKLHQNQTYLFEIIYPVNRIVVDYGNTDDLVLLAIIDNETGDDIVNDVAMQDIGFQEVKRYDGINDLEELKKLDLENKEGFVVRFSNGFRVKMKFEEYIRLHRIMTGVSNIAIWEYLAEGKSFEELLEQVPDEFYDWVQTTVADLNAQFAAILAEAKSVYKEFPTRKETALYFNEQKYPGVLFNLYTGKSPDIGIWRLIRPQFAKPFKSE